MTETPIHNQAKFLHGAEKTASTKSSFQNKLNRMRAVLFSWREAGIQGTEYWPKTLDELKTWHEPEIGIFSWSSDSVTARGGRYKVQVDEYWHLKKQLTAFVGTQVKLEIQNRALKLENTNLSEQIASLVWAIMDYRDAITRLDPNNIVLTRHPFP